MLEYIYLYFIFHYLRHIPLFTSYSIIYVTFSTEHIALPKDFSYEQTKWGAMCRPLQGLVTDEMVQTTQDASIRFCPARPCSTLYRQGIYLKELRMKQIVQMCQPHHR